MLPLRLIVPYLKAQTKLSNNFYFTIMTISESLRKCASALIESSPDLVAVGLLKQAGLSEEQARAEVAQHVMEKKAVNLLAFKGVDPDEAVKLVKAANVNFKDLASFEQVSDEERTADLLVKAACYIETLELEALSLKNRPTVNDTEYKKESPELPESLQKMASARALTYEDVEALQAMPQDTLLKIASAVEQPWGVGQAIGSVKPQVMDPILAFCLGGD